MLGEAEERVAVQADVTMTPHEAVARTVQPARWVVSHLSLWLTGITTKVWDKFEMSSGVARVLDVVDDPKKAVETGIG